MTWLIDYCQQIWLVLAELAPWFLLGAWVAGLMHGLAPSGFVRRRFSGTSGVVWATVLGIPLPLCSCAVIPTGIGLRRNGASEGASVGFLIATPQTGIDSVFVTAAFLGWTFAIYKLVVALILGVTAGWIIEWFGNKSPAGLGEKTSDASQPTSSCCQAEAEPQSTTLENAPSVSVSLGVMKQTTASSSDVQMVQLSATKPKTDCCSSNIASPSVGGSVFNYSKSSFFSSLSIVRSIYLWVLVGVMISAALSTLIPQEAISQFSSQSYGLQLLVALLIGIPLYVCATASVPIAAALVGRGLSVGATAVFLIAGPATNIATIGAIKSQFSRLAFWTYLATAILGSLLFAILFDVFFPGQIAGQELHQHEHSGWLNQISAAILLAIFAYIWISGQWKRIAAPDESLSASKSCCS